MAWHYKTGRRPEATTLVVQAKAATSRSAICLLDRETAVHALGVVSGEIAEHHPLARRQVECARLGLPGLDIGDLSVLLRRHVELLLDAAVGRGRELGGVSVCLEQHQLVLDLALVRGADRHRSGLGRRVLRVEEVVAHLDLTGLALGRALAGCLSLGRGGVATPATRRDHPRHQGKRRHCKQSASHLLFCFPLIAWLNCRARPAAAVDPDRFRGHNRWLWTPACGLAQEPMQVALHRTEALLAGVQEHKATEETKAGNAANHEPLARRLQGTER